MSKAHTSYRRHKNGDITVTVAVRLDPIMLGMLKQHPDDESIGQVARQADILNAVRELVQSYPELPSE